MATRSMANVIHSWLKARSTLLTMATLSRGIQSTSCNVQLREAIFLVSLQEKGSFASSPALELSSFKLGMR